MEATVDSFLR